MNTSSTLRRPWLALAALAIASFVGCAGGAAASVQPASPAPAATPVPSDLAGGGSGGNPGTGVVVPGDGTTDPGIVGPDAGQPLLVVAKPGQLTPHPVGAMLLEPAVEGRRVLVKVSWYSGVEPCHVLDSVEIDHGANEFVITIVEGTSDPNAMCIEIAQLKATIVDLGELEPGEYMIRASEGEAPPVTVIVS